jgi:hypothetical protein
VTELPICGVCEEEPAVLDGLAPLKMKDWEEAIQYPVPLCRGCAETIIYQLMHVWLTVRKRSAHYAAHRDYEQTRMLTKIRCSRCNRKRVIEDPYAFEIPAPIDQGALLAEVPAEAEPDLGGWLGLLEDADSTKEREG